MKAIDTINKALEMLSDGDFENYESLLAEDMYFKMCGSTPLSGEAFSKDEFLATVGNVMALLAGPIKLNVKKVIDGGDWVISIADGEATTLSGKPYNNEYCHIWKVKDGLIIELREFLDTALLRDIC
tara:strand:- start:3839 stop:4219 length:381 start_codon:yes stop_codon:yes gene_type:complete